MEQPATLRAVLCKIVDADFHEQIGDPDPTYSASVVLLMEELENGTLFQAPLSDQDMQELSGIGRALSNREMINLAQKLQSWQGKHVLMFVNPEHQEITMDMILTEEARVITPIETPIETQVDDSGQSIINLDDTPGFSIAPSNTLQQAC